MAAGALYAAGCVQFGKEPNQHAQSLPSAGPERKSATKAIPDEVSLRRENKGVSLAARPLQVTRVRKSLVLAGLLAGASSLYGQGACPPLRPPVVDTSKLLLTPAQETQLGEIIRQQLESKFLVIDEDSLTGYLRRVGDRVARQLPASGLRFQFFLYDQPEIQAFGMPGGNIYVSRKMVAFLRTEDELAGLLGHELGHLAVRQQALGLSRQFHDVLGIKSFSDNEDLFEKYHQLVESFRLKKTRGGSGDEGQGQMVADQAGIEMVTRAGYSPGAYPDFLDRLMQTKGKTGSWLSDVFGSTRPDAKRLREALRTVGSLPAACIEKRVASRSGDFEKWQSDALRYNGIGHGERLAGVLERRKLKDPLRGDIENFRFSPDGRYLLAQDDGGIYVLTRDPLQFVFRIETPDAALAQFTPDSRQVVFYSPALRVETWDIAKQEQVLVSDVAALRGCRQTALSPDAKFLACFGGTLDLSLYNVATGETVFHKDKFFDPLYGIYHGYFLLLRILTGLAHQDLVVLRFSPDGRYFAASSPGGEDVVFDLLEQKKINVPGTVHAIMSRQFTFVGAGRMVGLDPSHPEKSPIVEFPGGKVIDRVPLGGGSLLAATNPRYVLVRPLQKRPLGAYDLETKKIVFSNRTAATDIWGDTVASERLTGEVGTYKVAGAALVSKVDLPLGKLGTLEAAAVSPDLKWLAVSNHTRGGVWSLATQDRALTVRGFRDVSGEPGQLFYFDFPKFEVAERNFSVMNPETRQSATREIGPDDDVRLFGSVILRTTHNGKDREAHKNVQLAVVDTVREKPLWSRSFPKEEPHISGSPASGRLVFLWGGDSEGARDEIAREPRLQSRWSRESLGQGDYFAEVVDARSGQVLGATAIRTGKRSFSMEHIEAAGDWLVGTDNRNRVLVFSVATGEEKARWFGYHPRISPNGQRLCVSNGRGHLLLYDLRTLKQTGELFFANRVSTAFFSSDGSRLAVLTEDQDAFLLDAEAAPDSAGSQARTN